jgi:flagellar hook-associated protein 1 FlgK
MLGGRPLVDGTDSKAISLNVGTPITLSLNGEAEPLRALGGRVGALLDVANRDIAAALTSLDQLASALITDVNALHARGWSPTAGATGNWDPLLPPTGSGVLFFDGAPANATARTIRLSAAIAGDSNAIAVSDTLDATGNNAIGLAIASLRDFSPTAAGNSFGGAYRVTIARIAGSARAAADSAVVANTVIDQARARRAATSDVSTDEELMRLMKHQQAYAAAAKIVQTIDELSRVLLELKS